MSSGRAHATALTLVNWKGVFFEHFWLDRHVTALEGANGAAEAYLGFLKAGSSLYPVDALKRAGVDMATPEAVEKTYGVLAEYVDRLEKLTGN